MHYLLKTRLECSVLNSTTHFGGFIPLIKECILVFGVKRIKEANLALQT